MKFSGLFPLLLALGVISLSVRIAYIAFSLDEYDEEMKPIYPYDQWPVWSPDGKQLIFVSNRNPMGDKWAPTTLWIVNADGSRLRQVVSRYGLEHPAWSPNGKFLAFNSGAQIYVFDLEATKAYPLFGIGEHGFYPSWGPDSHTLTFSAQRRDDPDIYIAELDFTASRILKREKIVVSLYGADTQPVWSPDGKWIAFVHDWKVGNETVAQEIFIVHPDGTGLKRLCQITRGHDVERLHWLSDSQHLLICQMRGGLLSHVELVNERPKRLPSYDEFLKAQEELDAHYEHSVPYQEGLKILQRYGGYYERVGDKYLVFRYEFDQQGNPIYDPQNKILNVITGEVRGFTLPYGQQNSPSHPIGAGQIAVSPDGKRIAFMSNSSNYPNTFGTSIWIANLDGSQPREITKPPQPPDPELPIIVRLDPDFPIPLSRKVGSIIELKGIILHPSGWEATKDVEFRFTLRASKSTSFSIQFERAANVFRLLGTEGKPTGRRVKPSSQGCATLGGVTLVGEKSMVKAMKKVAIVHIAFKIIDPKLRGEWLIEMRAQGTSGKTTGWQRMGWLNVN